MKLALALLLLTATAAQAQDGRAWTLSNDKTLPEVALIYGAPNSDDVVATLRCPRGTGQVTASFPVSARLADRLESDVWVDRIGRPAPWPASVTLASGLASATLRGQATADDLNGGSLLSAEVATRAPVIAAFKQTGAITLSGLGETKSAPPVPLKQVRPFLSACK
ncbi:MAG: hypothetical protein KA085_05865 [Phenylobacterium sp.]|uniref:hypothetical protein n=1 Tax=Phenylobacterium sp. TaxID=1871053 RepID=UPI001B659567|nr:hypothetical protein [Phenylobacterium sp.]MBP7651401.1 hypothetical protein [Phenylobacterium sp.]MBP7815632.1 hypothetical protein [Phenylobacterium sp.]MBP9229900.1 hypothetical protein [Phenylobacterium sp.]MBP9754184.1 hypothetical protein [Phenylobacterium sp.]